MRAKYYLPIVMLFMGVLLFAANGFDVEYYQPTLDQYELNFNLDDFQLGDTVKNGVIYSTIDFEGGVTTKDAGFAEVPYIHATVQISADKNVTLEIVSSEYEEFDLSYPLLPSRGTIYRNQDPSTIPYEIAEESIVDKFYPAQLAETVEPFVVRDIRGTIVYVYPFQYNAARNILRVYSTVTVKLTNDNSSVINPLPIRASGITREMNNMYRTMFMNYDVSRFENELGEYGSILVIHTPRDADAIAPYVEWKQQKGFTVYVEEVVTGTNVTTLVTNQYAAHDDILYVQLVGDWEDISGTVLGGDPADPKLGCVVGTDIYPDLVIGRFSAGSAIDVATQVDKSITYERDPDSGQDWYEFAVGIASNQGPGDDNELDYAHIQNIYDNKLDPFTYESHTPIYDPTANTSMVATAVNAGTSIINYCGHGSTSSWGTTGFSNSHVNMLTNGTKLPFIISVACVNGNFDGGTCFAEAWLRKDGGGAIGMLASTQNQSWNPPMMGQDYINDLLIGGYDYSLYPGQNGTTTDVQKTTYGSMCFNGTILMAMEDGAQGAEEMAKWHVFGDASLQVRTDTPEVAALSNNVILMGVDFTTVVTAGGSPAQGALVSLYQEGDVFSGITDETGSVTISHGLTAGDAQLIVTGFNIDTIYDNIAVIPPGGAYVMFEDCLIEDQTANNNGLLDYGETVELGITLVNVGTDEATGVTATISSTDPYLTIIDDTENYGNITGGASAMISGAFQISVDDLVPDGHGIMISLEATDGVDTWESNFTLTAHAPILETGMMIIEDIGGNGMLDPGETATIFIPVTNNGSALSPSLVAELTSVTSDFITVTSSTFNLDATAAGEEAMAEFELEVAAGVEPGTTAILSFVATGGEYVVTSTFYPSIGLVFEDFETGDFSKFDWQQGTSGWEITESNPQEGIYCAKSSVISNNQTASISVTMDIPADGEISFYRKVSSENNWDYMRFYINNQEQDEWSGDVAWSEVIYDVTAGTDVEFKWTYEKDGSVSSGSDCAWLDYIVFPGIGGAAGPIISVNVTEINFGEVNIGETGVEEFTIFNLGSEDLTGTIDTVEDFVLSVDEFILTAGSSIDVEVSFTPVEAMNYTGNVVITSNDANLPEIEIPVEGIGVGTNSNNNLIPLKTELTGNYPNPFNPVTNISFAIKSAGNVSIEIFNVKGEKVKTLVNENLEPGYYSKTWNGNTDNLKSAASGIYFYKMRAGEGYTNTRKMILLK